MELHRRPICHHNSARSDAGLAATHATHEAAAVVDTAYSLAGSNAIFENRPFERRFRDVHAVTQQAQANPRHFEATGRVFLGLDPESSYV